jgi:atypical dual specificity phosphatase
VLRRQLTALKVHCLQGISRSATVVCAYIIATADTSMTASEAIAFVQNKRWIVCPNIGFRAQLESYATRFVGKGERRTLRICAGIAERMRKFASNVS